MTLTPDQIRRQVAKIHACASREEIDGYRLGLRLTGRPPHVEELRALAEREAGLAPKRRRA